MRFLSFAGLLLTGCAFARGSSTPQGILQRPGFAWEALGVPGWRVYLDTTTEPHLPRTRLPGILDSARIAVLTALGIPSLPETISVFVVPSRARMKALVGREVNGTAFSRTNTIGVVLLPSGWVGVQHELLHIVAMQVWGVPDRWLNEGLAVAVDGNWHGYPLHALAHHLQTAGQLPSVEVLLHRFNQTDDLLTYPAAGSFVLFLLERYGRESLRRLWGGTDSWANIYAKSSTALEAEWLAVVKAAPSEGIVYPLTRTAGGTASNEVAADKAAPNLDVTHRPEWAALQLHFGVRLPRARDRSTTAPTLDFCPCVSPSSSPRPSRASSTPSPSG